MHLTWQQIEDVVTTRHHVCLSGPPGCGKTYLATVGASAVGAVYSLTLTEETPAAELRGHYVPKGGEFVWHDGPAIRAWREGARVVINEIDKASGDALTFLLALLDDPQVARLTLPTGETVKPRAGFQAVATCNGDPDQTLPPALRDRFAITIIVDEPHPNALTGLEAPLANAVRANFGHSDPARRISVRQAWAFTHLAQAMDDRETAAKAVWGSRGLDILNSLALAGASKKGR